MTQDGSAERLQRQIEELYRRIDIADAERRSLIERVDVDREMIVDLQAEGLVSAQHAKDLETALKSSRTIGTAIGVLMKSRGIDADAAFAILRQTSQDTNRKVREIAAEVVEASSQPHTPATGGREPFGTPLSGVDVPPSGN